MAPFEVSVSQHPGCAVVSVAGELDISTAPELEAVLAAPSGQAGSRTVVDLNGLDFIDSTGLTVLVRTSKRIDEVGGGFSIVCGRDKVEVHRVLEILGFDKVFEIYPTLAEAGCG